MAANPETIRHVMNVHGYTPVSTDGSLNGESFHVYSNADGSYQGTIVVSDAGIVDPLPVDQRVFYSSV